MKRYTFNIDNNKSTNNTINACTFCKPNYSKILDHIIATNIISSNKYLSDYYNPKKNPSGLSDAFIDANLSCPLKDGELLYTAAKKLFDLKNKKSIIFGKKYTFDGSTIIFYDDEIQIGCHTYKYDDILDYTFLNKLSEPTKKIIKIAIKINL